MLNLQQSMCFFRKCLPIIAIIFILTSCNSFFYFPSRSLFYSPEKLKIAYDDVHFYTKDKVKLHGWFLKSIRKDKFPLGTIVQFHGNAQNMTSHFVSLAWLTKLGYNVFSFDYRGYGDSENKDPDKEGLRLDGTAAIQYCLDLPVRKRGAMFVVHGQSLGGIVAMETILQGQWEKKIDLIVIESSFSSYQSIARDKLSDVWLTWPFQWLAYLLISDSGAPEEQVKKFSPVPVLIIHGDKDRIVPEKFGKKIFSDAKEPKIFWNVADGRHLSTFFMHKGAYRKKYLQYLMSLKKVNE